MRVEILEFEGNIHLDKFINWLQTVERIFYFKKFPEDRKVKLVALKLINMLPCGGRILRIKELMRTEAISSLKGR